GVRAVRAVDAEAQAGQVGAEALDDVLEVAVGGDADAVELAASRGRGVEERLDLLLGIVGELLPVAVEQLDAVELGRVVGGRDDHAEVEGEERDGRGRQDAGQNGAPTCRDDACGEGLLELRSGAARVTPDEDSAPARPHRRRPSEPLDEVGGEDVADDSPDSVRAEIAPGHGARAYGRHANVWRTAARGGPCGARPSCARRSARRG